MHALRVLSFLLFYTVGVSLSADCCLPAYIEIGAGYDYFHSNLSAPTDRQGGTQQQVFVTAGFSRLTPCESGFNDRLGIEGHASYMHPHSASDGIHSRNYGANIYIGLTYSFGGSEACQKPYLDVANNSNFYTDTDLNF